jgi:hypothetical protein
MSIVDEAASVSQYGTGQFTARESPEEALSFWE